MVSPLQVEINGNIWSSHSNSLLALGLHLHVKINGNIRSSYSNSNMMHYYHGVLHVREHDALLGNTSNFITISRPVLLPIFRERSW